MDTQQKEPTIDPLRRVFVPRETLRENGCSTFRTTDGERYVRLPSGEIRGLNKKVNGKEARKARAKARRCHQQ